MLKMASEASKSKAGSGAVAEDDGEQEEVISLRKLNFGQKEKKLLVVDLNGLLAHIFFTSEGVKVPPKRLPDGVFGLKLVFKRPFCEEFLKFCFQRFQVGIWSSAKVGNVNGVVPFIFGKWESSLLFVLNQSHCTITSFKTVEKKHKPIFLKELKKLWKKEFEGLPWEKGQYSPSNTLLLDDSPYKALLNPPNTAIFPYPYTVDQEEDVSLGPMGDLSGYLKGLAAAEDVPSYVKVHGFGQNAISTKHPDWHYYSKIIHHFDHQRSSF